jgi:hypothetical protein
MIVVSRRLRLAILEFTEGVMSKGPDIGFVFGLLMLGILGTGASRQARSNEERRNNERYRAEIRDATPVQLGVLNQKPRTNSRLFNAYSKSLPGESITDLIASHRGRRIVLERNVYGRAWLSSAQPDVPEEYFRRLAGECDAVIRGKAFNKASQITEDDSFLFTDYEVAVLEVLKNDLGTPLTDGRLISVTGVGGKIVADNVIIKAGGNGVAILPVNDAEVVLFLKHVPGGEGFQLTNSGAFQLTGVAARPLAGLFNFDPTFFEDQTSFLATITRASKSKELR